jgi:hypothetical protein
MKHEWPIDVKVGLVEDHLRRARQHLVDFGWIQNSATTGQGSCAAGAILYFEDVRRSPVPTLDYLTKALPCGDYLIARWNDQPGRTKEEVLMLYDRAIKAAHKDGV